MIHQPFAPKFGSTVQVSPAAASANSTTFDRDRSSRQVRFVNTGAAACYVRTFDTNNSGTAGYNVATVADHLVPAGMSSTISKPAQHNGLAYISAAGTTLEASLGEGY